MKRIDYFSILHRDEQGTFADLGESLSEYLVRMHLIHIAACQALGCSHEANLYKWLLTEIDVALSITIVTSRLQQFRRPTLH